MIKTFKHKGLQAFVERGAKAELQSAQAPKLARLPTPGLTLRDDVLPALGLTVTEAAAQLDVTRNTLSRVLNGHAEIASEMALRLEKWLAKNRCGDARLWLDQQTA